MRDMTDCFRRFPGYVLQGYGQLFLCNNVLSGILFLCALFLISPIHAGFSLAGASLVTLGAQRFCRKKALLKTGLFGVNGVLLGYLWVLFPEVSPAVALAATAAGSVLLVAILVPVTTWLQRRASPFTVFSLPAVLILWLCLGILSLSGHYDLTLYKAWQHFFNRSYNESEILFQKSSTSTARAEAYTLDGLGWIAFHRSDYIEAVRHFHTAIDLDSSFGDPYDGAGWAAFKRGDIDGAIRFFSQSLSRNPVKGTSWDGLGWCHYLQGRYGTAETAFHKSILSTPFFSDPYLGLAMCREAGKIPATVYRSIYGKLKAADGTSLTLLSTLHLAGWILFLIGIFVHSRISALAAGVILLCAVIVTGSTDVNLYYNLAALVIALAGAYLVLGPSAVVTAVLGCMVMAMTWHWWKALLLPVTCLPFNIFLIVMLLICHGFKGRWGIETVPLEIAVTTPENVIWWKRKKDLLIKCRKFLMDHDRGNPL
jgi:tetratricopeptide (TPR) repeat protein